MAEELTLNYSINRPSIDVSREETEIITLLTIQLSHALQQSQETELKTHLVLVIDVSSSMGSREIFSLKQAVHAALDQLRSGDYVSVVAFQSVAYEIVEPTRIYDSSTVADLKRRIDIIDQYQGGGTDLEYGLIKGRDQILSLPELGQTKRMIVFTDGEITGDERECLKTAANLAERSIGIDAVGFGTDFDYKFMQRLVSYSNGTTAYIQDAQGIGDVFADKAKRLTNVVATHVTLTIDFSAVVRANFGYRYSPEIAYLGRIRLPETQRTIDIPIGTLEKDMEYAYLVTLTVPKRELGPIRVFKATLTYDIPSLNIVAAQSTQSIVVTYSDHPREIAHLNGEVARAYDEVEIGRLVEVLDTAIKKGEHKTVSILFDKLSEQYKELGDQDMATHYLTMKTEYATNGGITKEQMNYTRHKSTQKRDTGTTLVDASSLI